MYCFQVYEQLLGICAFDVDLPQYRNSRLDYNRAICFAKAGGNVDSVDGESTADVDEQIYWLRPKLRPSPAQSPTDGNATSMSDKGWLNKKLKPKVTFNDLPSTSGSR